LPRGGRGATIISPVFPAGEERRFGLDADRFITHKLRNASPDELRLVLSLARHFESPEIGEGLRDVVVNRNVPLALKLECFKVMTELGQSLDDTLLQQLHEAEEMYHQVSNLLRNGDEESLARSISLADDFKLMPAALKMSFVRQLSEEWGVRAVSFAGSIVGIDPDVDGLLVDLVGDSENPEAVELLVRISEAGGKEAVKSARKALYKLRQRGVEGTTVSKSSEETDEAASTADGEQAFASNIDTFGVRMLLPHAPSGCSGAARCARVPGLDRRRERPGPLHGRGDAAQSLSGFSEEPA